VNSQELRDLIKPCGLQDSREKSLRAVAYQFIATDWTQPNEMYGIGALGNDRLVARRREGEDEDVDLDSYSYVVTISFVWASGALQRQTTVLLAAT